jgi:hypothetical protein
MKTAAYILVLAAMLSFTTGAYAGQIDERWARDVRVAYSFLKTDAPGAHAEKYCLGNGLCYATVTYRIYEPGLGYVRHVRFTLPMQEFDPWSRVHSPYPGRWSKKQIKRLHRSAKVTGGSQSEDWWIRDKPLRCIGAHISRMSGCRYPSTSS